ncbi:hypothetical protein OWV82_022363 [Melia azedarach]|uniref:Uncharacterized protein n=1 Tax=Melia azedarach TaxID=155640 RepID=A0ACC1X3U8_MELAZ|nr:hypothetical protein OWV82_022363 [Melia azedarach]
MRSCLFFGGFWESCGECLWINSNRATGWDGRAEARVCCGKALPENRKRKGRKRGMDIEREGEGGEILLRETRRKMKGRHNKEEERMKLHLR